MSARSTTTGLGLTILACAGLALIAHTPPSRAAAAPANAPAQPPPGNPTPSAPKPAAPAPPAPAANPQQAEEPRWVTAGPAAIPDISPVSARVGPAQSRVLNARFAGVVTAVMVRPGDVVEADQAIIEIDSPEMASRIYDLRRLEVDYLAALERQQSAEAEINRLNATLPALDLTAELAETRLFELRLLEQTELDRNAPPSQRVSAAELPAARSAAVQARAKVQEVEAQRDATRQTVTAARNQAAAILRAAQALHASIGPGVEPPGTQGQWGASTDRPSLVRVRAPSAGYIVGRVPQVGEVFSAPVGDPSAAMGIAPADRSRLSFSLIANVHAAPPLFSFAEMTSRQPVSATVVAFGQATRAATVTITNAVTYAPDPQIEFEHAPGEFQKDELVTVIVPLGGGTQVPVAVPLSAIGRTQEQAESMNRPDASRSVWVERNGNVELRAVRMGRTDGQVAEITDGLKANERVLRRWQQTTPAATP